jgi:D-glycero-alpha-D-manno-heptose 1-phosphate guanylyltransferase
MSDWSDLTVVILAGGKGTRLQGLFPDVPKPLVSVAGRPFLSWLTLWIARHGPTHFVYSTGYKGEQIDAWVQNERLPGIHRKCCREESPLGTGGGLLNCLELCRDWIMVANGDGLVMGGVADLASMMHRDTDGALLGVSVRDASRYGSLETDSSGRLLGFHEKVGGQGLINGGLYLFRKSVLSAQRRNGPLSLEQDLFPAMIAAGADFRVVRCDDAAFIDIGTPETVRQAELFVRTHVPEAASGS